MTTQEMIEVMQAYDRGEAIEVHFIGSESGWVTMERPFWNWSECNYRVKPKDDTLMVCKEDEANTLKLIDIYPHRVIVASGTSQKNYVKADDVLWYWEYQDADGRWHKTDYRATRAEIEKLSNFHNFSPLYALGFRIKDEK